MSEHTMNASTTLKTGQAPHPRQPTRWGCGCAVSQCQLNWEDRPDPGSPRQTHRVTCVTHQLTGTSESGRAEDMTGLLLQIQAMHRLDLAHQEQCR